MRQVNMRIFIGLFIFLFCMLTYLPAEDRPAAVLHTPGERYSSEENRQHYLQGKEFYSQGRYEEARIEFEKSLESISPPRLVTEKVGEQQKALEIVPLKAAVPKAKVGEKKKEEKKTEGNEVGVTKAAITSAPAPEAEEAQAEREYYIDAGDVLDISVWQIPDLSRSEVIIRPDGKISYPLIGDIKAEGLTLTKLDNIITEKLKTYVKVPEVSIMMRRFGERGNINKVVILGEVLSAGVYRFSGPPSIAEVVASAGGYTKYAVINSIMIIRDAVMRNKPEVIKINLAHILKGNKYSNNILLKPNDIVYVPRSLIGNLNTFMELIQPAISEYMQTLDARNFHNTMIKNQ